MAKCRGCQAEILWGKTERGKAVPLNPPEKRYVHRSSDGAYLLIDTYMPHHATCPKVEDFR